MIENYRDHAANERTYLAWIRTAIALMAFGFVIEKFDLFLRYLAGFVPQAHLAHNTPFGEYAGLVMIVAGVAIVGLSLWNFLTNRRSIDAPEGWRYRGKWSNLILGIIVAALGIFLTLYVSLTLASGK